MVELYFLLAGFIQQLRAFRLSDGVIAERGDAVNREERARALVRFARLAVRVVSAREQHRGIRRFRLRKIHQRGDVELRTALVDHLLDAVRPPIERIDNARVQRRLLRPPAQLLHEEVAGPLLVRRGVFRRFDLLVGLRASIEGLDHLRAEVRLHHLRGFVGCEPE